MNKLLHKVRFDDLIIAETDSYTIVNKPAFLSCLEDRFDTINLLALARKSFADYQICHRIDKETSGIVVLAKNQEAYRSFAMQLEDRQVKKVYHTVAHTTHTFENFEAAEPLYTTTNKSRVEFKLGKPSLTLIQTLESFRKHALLKCFPVTGRMHQIRVHLAYHEAPIVADPAYGGDDLFLSSLKRNYRPKEAQEERPLINRVALHAQEIAFLELNEEVVTAQAPYPKEIDTILKVLRKYN